ncbi:MAG: HAMP domain-containing protein, partial [Firmicutes bacterium]|nr:HAMP domain-containing protein [Bacillota bacterium]
MKIRFDFKSIRFRIWVYFLILAVLILALVWFLQVYFMKEYYEEMKMREVTSMSNAFTTAYNNDDESLADSIRNMSVTNDYYFMMEYGGQLLTFQPDSEVTKPVYTYQRLVPNLKDALSTSEGGDHASVKFSAGPEDYYVLGYVKILETVDASEESQETEEEPDNNVYLYIFTPLYPVDSTVHILQGQLTLITVMALVVAFILALLFSRRLSRPIKAITSEARKLGDGDFNVKFQGKSYSEVNRLAETLNTAAYEMAQADNRQKDLIANVSHDLKTPLTLIRSYAEMIRDLSGDDPVKRNANLEVIM